MYYSTFFAQTREHCDVIMVRHKYFEITLHVSHIVIIERDDNDIKN